MASRPLPPGRRGRGARAAPALHLPDVKILSDAVDAPTGAMPTSSYAEQLRAQPSVTAAAVGEPEHESTTKDVDYEPTPVRSVKAFVSSLEKAQDPVVSDRIVAAAAAGEDAPLPRSRAAPAAATTPAAAAVPPQVVVEKPTSPVVVSAATAPIKQVAQAPVQQARIPPPPVQAAAAGPPVAFEAPVARISSAPAVDASALEGVHPFKALLPIYTVPDIPETVDCVFDDAALEMQKNIMKVVKKIFGKDRTKLEDFKINSRLFGNNFMDPLEYVESLVKDLGGNRALVLVPCLVSIQPDFMKRSSMLVAARNYRLRCLAKLEASLDKVEAAAPPTVPAPVELATPKTKHVPEAATTAAAVGTAAVVIHEVAQEDAPTTLDAGVTVQETSSDVEVVQEETPGVEVESHVTVERCYAEEPADAFVPPVNENVPEAVAEAVPQPTLVTSEPIAYAVSEPMVYAVSEPQAVEAVLMEPNAPLETPLAASLASVETPALVSAAVEPTHETPTYIATASAPVEEATVEPAPISYPEPIVEPPAAMPVENTTPETIARPTDGLQSAGDFITVDTTVFSETSSVSSAPATPSAASPVHNQPIRRKSTISLFGEEIADDDDEDESDNEEEEAVKTILPASIEAAAPTSTPARTPSPEPSPASSFYEAESLFGEVLPVAVKPATESPAPTPVPSASILKPPPARTGMLFGFASAGGDSDSDSDSEFSD